MKMPSLFPNVAVASYYKSATLNSHLSDLKTGQMTLLRSARKMTPRAELALQACGPEFESLSICNPVLQSLSEIDGKQRQELPRQLLGQLLRSREQ